MSFKDKISSLLFHPKKVEEETEETLPFEKHEPSPQETPATQEAAQSDPSRLDIPSEIGRAHV